MRRNRCNLLQLGHEKDASLLTVSVTAELLETDRVMISDEFLFIIRAEVVRPGALTTSSPSVVVWILYTDDVIAKYLGLMWMIYRPNSTTTTRPRCGLPMPRTHPLHSLPPVLTRRARSLPTITGVSYPDSIADTTSKVDHRVCTEAYLPKVAKKMSVDLRNRGKVM